MTWFRVDDDLPFHRKVVMAGNAAMGLWVRAGAWSAQQLTDGFVPDDMIALIGTPAQRRKLVSARLWVEVEGGCQFHEWSDSGRQPTAQNIRERRSDAAKRQQKYRDNNFRSSQVSGPRNAVTDSAVTDEVTKVLTPPPPTRPVVTTPSGVVTDPDSLRSSGRAELALVPTDTADVAVTEPPTAQHCTGGWVDAYRDAHDAEPTRQQTGQAARESAALIKAGNPPDRVLHAAQTAGAKGYATVQREYQALAKRHRGPARPSTTDARVMDALTLAAHYEAQESG